MQLTENSNRQFQPDAVTLGSLVVNEMRMLYGAKFAQQWEGLTPRDLKAAWGEKLIGLNEREIRLGLTACLSRDWPPTVPEFLRMCRPGLVPEVAFHDAVNGTASRRRGEIGSWSHPAVYWAAVTVGTHDLLNCGYSVMKSRWERALSEELAKGQWPEIPHPHVALPAPGNTMADRKEAQAAMKAIGADKALDQTGKDLRRWMQKIQDKIDRKESVSPTILHMLKLAKEAIGEAA